MDTKPTNSATLVNSWIQLLQAIAILGFLAFGATSVVFAKDTIATDQSQVNPASLLKAKQSLLKSPLSFELNRGQTDASVQFLSRGSGYNLFLTAEEAVLSLTKQPEHKEEAASAGKRDENPAETTAVRLKLVGSNLQCRVQGEEMLPGKVHYFIGNDPKNWHRNVPTYGKVRYSDIYPGIDLVYYGKEGKLEYDFEVKPGADPMQIAFQIQGTGKLSLDQGELILETAAGELRLQAPRIYQRINGVETKISGTYLLQANNSVSFRLEGYDHQNPLIIDPVLSYSTYLGGSGLDDIASRIAADATGAVYVSGNTNSANFPATPPFHNSTDVFITKLSPQGQRVYSIFLGGGNFDSSGGIAVSPSKSVYVTGYTYSGDFPRVRAIQSTLRGNSDAFVTQFSPSGSAITFSTLLGGSASSARIEQAVGIKLDRARRIYVFGQTNSHDFPVKDASQKHFAGGNTDGFLTILSPAGNSIVFSTFIGRKFDDIISSGAVNLTRGDVYTSGVTATDRFSFPSEPFIAHLKTSSSSTVPGLHQARYSQNEIFLFQSIFNFTPRESSELSPWLAWIGYVPPIIESVSSSVDHSIASAGTVYIAIATCLTTGPPSPCFDNGSVGVLDADLHPLSTIHFGGDISSILGIATDRQGSVYITGVAGRQPFPLVNPIQGTFRGGNFDAFVMRFSPGAAQMTFSSFLGGNKDDFGFGIAVDPKGNMYVCGQTTSTNFPRVHAIQHVKKGPNDGFVVKISP